MGRTSPVAPLIRRRGKDYLEEGRQQESSKDERSTSHHKSSRRNRRKRRSSQQQQQQEPFLVLFVKVGTFLFLVLVLIYYVTLYASEESTFEPIMDMEKDLADDTQASSADHMSGGQIGSIGSAKTNEKEETGSIPQKKQPTKPATRKNATTTGAAIPPPLLVLPQFPPLPPEAAADAYGIATRLEQVAATLSSSDHH
eukprot:scaffold63173_cov48-Attheya_sp.AAC.1